tara:strand:- start:127 stop:339 length:213 start_codon:yes stop_codon:yes gene_type:complete
MNTTTMDLNKLEMLTQREQLMEDINCIVDEYFQSIRNECTEMGEMSNIDEAQDDLFGTLCDAVCANFPTN